MARLIMPLVLALVGAWITYVSYQDVDGFFENRKARRLVAIVGRKAARVIYMIAGVVMVGMALTMAVGIFTGQVTV